MTNRHTEQSIEKKLKKTFMEQERFKVNITALENGVNFLTVLNFNIPHSAVADNEHEFDELLRIVSNFLVDRFPIEFHRVSFEVSATYHLLNSETGNRRVWCGSFSPRANQFSNLSGDVFVPFNPNTFANVVKHYCRLANVVERLNWTDQDTKTTFDGLISYIISCQINLHANHVFFRNYNLLQATDDDASSTGARGQRRGSRRQQQYRNVTRYLD